MILIVSKQAYERSTEAVIDWLHAKGAKWVRLNGEQVTQPGGESIAINTKEDTRQTDLAVGWYRRWIDTIDLTYSLSQTELTDSSKIALTRARMRDAFSLQTYLLNQKYKIRHWLTHPSKANVNKLEVLELAKAKGLDIPATLITSSKADLQQFILEYGLPITKAISDAPIIRTQDETYILYTHQLTQPQVQELPESFPVSLFQEAVKKAFEVRTFFLDGECFSMAIFSQLDAKTSGDFRNYNTQKPNRTVPYLLPDRVGQKVSDLMQGLGLNTGSLDFLVTPEDHHIFLEVNPVGQFGMTSQPCNYYLEKKVAEYLAAHDQAHEQV